MSIQENITKRLLAEQTAWRVRDFILEMLQEQPLDDEQTFWNELAAVVHEHVEPPKPVVVRNNPMTKNEAEAYGRRKLGFGKFATMPIRSIPLEYLLWLDGENHVMSRYLASESVQGEQNDPRDDANRY